MCSVWFVGCKKQRRVSDCEAIFVSDGDVYVRAGDVGADDDRGKLSGLSAVCVDLW